MKQLRVIIDKDGKTQVAVECGVVGEACQSLTERIERALGTVASDTPLEAMYQTQDVEVKA